MIDYTKLNNAKYEFVRFSTWKQVKWNLEGQKRSFIYTESMVLDEDGNCIGWSYWPVTPKNLVKRFVYKRFGVCLKDLLHA